MEKLSGFASKTSATERMSRRRVCQRASSLFLCNSLRSTLQIYAVPGFRASAAISEIRFGKLPKKRLACKTDRMRAITVKQPWPHAIFHAAKDIENRSQNLIADFPIDLAIHVSKTVDPDARFPRGFAKFLEDADAYDPKVRGKIIGVVTLVKIVETHRSPWYRKGTRFAYVIENPRLLKTPLDARGYQCAWEVPAETVKKFRFK